MKSNSFYQKWINLFWFILAKNAGWHFAHNSKPLPLRYFQVTSFHKDMDKISFARLSADMAFIWNPPPLTREAKVYFSHASQSEIQYLFVWLFIISCKYSNPFPLEKVCLCMTGIQIGFIIVLYSLVQLSLEIKRNSFSRFSLNVISALSEFLTQEE